MPQASLQAYVRFQITQEILHLSSCRIKQINGDVLLK